MNTDKHILIIDDDAMLSELLKIELIDAGLMVSLVHDGKEGLEMALKEHPDLILLDVLMPVMNGLEMLKKLRADEWGKDVHVILLTNTENNETISQALTQGVDQYLVKTDWELSEIVEKVQKSLAERE